MRSRGDSLKSEPRYQLSMKKVNMISLTMTILLTLLSQIVLDTRALHDLNIQTVSQSELSTNNLFGLIRIDTFETDGEMTGNVSFSIPSNDTLNFVLFLPSSVGVAWIVNKTSESELGFFEWSYLEESFKGKCFSYGHNFPWDYYELVFIFGFEASFLVKKENVIVWVSFGDRMLDIDWQFNYALEKMERQEVSGYVNHVAPSIKELESLIEANHLTSFYVIKTTLYRSETNVTKLTFLWFPPVLILVVLVASFFVLIVKHARLGESIRLYTGTGFFLSAYLFSLREFVPPTLTWVEGLVLGEIIFSMVLLLLAMCQESDRITNLAGAVKQKLRRLLSIVHSFSS